jgi:hypothetical protein
MSTIHSRMLFTTTASIIFCCITGCGRYQAPEPPEYFAPRGVQDFAVKTSVEGVTISWQSPHEDQRGRELTSLDGYRLLRKNIARPADIFDASIEYEELAFLEDLSVFERERLRDQAKADGRISRRIQAPLEKEKFHYLDSTVLPGNSYVYKLIPINQGRTEGRAAPLVRVAFRGEQSQVRMVTSHTLEDLEADPETGV